MTTTIPYAPIMTDAEFEANYRRNNLVPSSWSINQYKTFIVSGGNLIVSNDHIIDEETGECYDLVDIQVGHAVGGTEFHVTDRSSAEWVMSKILSDDCELAAIDLEEKAILERLATRRKRVNARREWKVMRFAAELEAFAAKELEGSKAKSVVLTHGKLQFRTSAGGAVSAKDQAAAIEWCRTNCPDAVVTSPRLVVTPLKEIVGELPRDLFDVSEASVKFSLDTGVKVSK